jgi:cystathionine beta-lyase
MTRELITELIQPTHTPPAGFEAPQRPVHKASTVVFKDVAAMRRRDWKHRAGYTYGLQGTPTTFDLEARIAALEGGSGCQLLPSGLAALTLVDMTFLSAGDEVLLPGNVYGPSRDFARHELARWGITHRLYDPMDTDSLAAALGPKTRLVWLEAPGSVTMEFPDLAALAALAKSRGVLTALDNTWGAGIALRGFDHGIDIVTQALTKYPSGGGDVLMGSVVTRDPALTLKLRATHMHCGFGVAGNDCELVLRSLATMPLRYAAQDAAARTLAQWLSAQPPVAAVLHPALPGAPGHAHWQRHCTAAAGLFSIVLDPSHSRDRVDAFVDALQLFRIGVSWAGPQSLVVPYDLTALRGPIDQRPAHLQGQLVRFSVGLEAVTDLQADLAQALAAAFD